MASFSHRSLSNILDQEQPLGRLFPEHSADHSAGDGAVSWPQSCPQVQQRLQAETQWWGSLAAVNQLLQTSLSPVPEPPAAEATPGVVISGPLPVLRDAHLLARVSPWILIPRQWLSTLPRLPAQGDPATLIGKSCLVPLDPEDPLGNERFCLVVMPHFSLSLVLGQGPAFRFSFAPALNEQIWQQMRSRIAQVCPQRLPALDHQIGELDFQAPDYRLVAQFSRLLLTHLPVETPSAPRTDADIRLASWEPAQAAAASANGPMASPPLERRPDTPLPWPPNQETPATSAPSADAELLQAMAHEIRTPLTTIRTLTRSLLKRQDIAEAVQRRLQLIDQACTQQIDRFNLIFRALELETQASQRRCPLAPMSLGQLFQDAIPLWQQQANRHNLTLAVDLPAQLPLVTSDPTLLNQVLTGLVERFVQGLPAQSHIQLVVVLAGHQLKLKFQATSIDGHSLEPELEPSSPPLRSLGHLLMLQPETGGLSLNLEATKNLFQALGGKLIVRQRPQQGEVLTVFLPLERRSL
ncbi:hypothetical protein XM38_032470 [Halomicronema hongdechloris C2206]|uniref:histidine kinase n=1 Tax=Halomicronema hongdechloris C2206 TaxID=1641165 RepID=A0A1Z3HPQ8_9CYAN|nr:HAMP domain-containing sensor histidine kinase [Halomicronema hongdechloris]ASC72291.1 hypothetical protein XM38_032470 [Halomicronema hongdechloris C2206]